MSVKPLSGMVLIEVTPPPTESHGGVALPGDVALSAEIVQEQSHDPEKPAKNNLGVVRAIGAWPKTRTGMLRMPEFGVGTRVVFNPWRGTQMANGQERLRMISQEDVLAVLG